jgi:hypothetical protein
LQLAQNSLRSLRSLRSNSCAKSVVEGASRLLQSPALLDGSQGPQEQYVARCAGIPSKEKSAPLSFVRERHPP